MSEFIGTKEDYEAVRARAMKQPWFESLSERDKEIFRNSGTPEYWNPRLAHVHQEGTIIHPDDAKLYKRIAKQLAKRLV